MKKIFQLSILLLLPFLTNAHGYWLEVESQVSKEEPVSIKMYYGEYSSQIREVGARLDKMSLIKVSVVLPNGQTQAIEMTQTNTHWEGSFTPQSDGYYQVLGLNDTREVQDWKRHKLGITRPIQYLRSQFTVGEVTASDNAFQFLDIYCQINTKNVEIYALKGEEPFQKTKIRVVNPDGWMQDKFSNGIGYVSVVPNKKGMYLVEIEWIEEVPGTFKGKAYETIRHKADMTFFSNNKQVSVAASK